MNKKLSEICDIQSGGTPSRSVSEYWTGGNIPWVKISDFEGKSLQNTEEFITEEGLNNSSAKIFKAGTILYTIFATLGEVCILNIDAATNQAIAGITIKNDAVNKDYLYHYLCSLKKSIIEKGRGVAQNNINMTILKNIEIPLPPLEIQREIAYNLDKAAEAVGLCRKILERLDYLVKAKFTEMFGDINLSKELDSWTPISQIGTVVGGATPKTNVPEYWDGEYRWITPAELDNAAGYIYDSARKLTKAGVESCSLQELPVGTVILSSRAPIGKVAIAGATFYCNQGFKNIICGDSVTPIYLYTLLQYNSDYLNSLGRGATFKEISKSIVSSIKIPVPPLPLQEQFAEYVKKTDLAKSAVKKSLEKAETLKSALMQKYFG